KAARESRVRIKSTLKLVLAFAAIALVLTISGWGGGLRWLAWGFAGFFLFVCGLEYFNVRYAAGGLVQPVTTQPVTRNPSHAETPDPPPDGDFQRMEDAGDLWREKRVKTGSQVIAV